MAVKRIKLKSYIITTQGRWKNDVYYIVNGKQYVCSYAVPRNPRTEAQQKNRTSFAEAVMLWQRLTQEKKNMYNELAVSSGSKGYNLFISMQMKYGKFNVISIYRGRNTWNHPFTVLRLNAVNSVEYRYYRACSITAHSIQPVTGRFCVLIDLTLRYKPPDTLSA